MKQPAGVILAGGLSRRMGGGDKGLLRLGGEPLIALVQARLAPQVAEVALNANGDAARFDALGLPVIADSVAEFPGPLAGVTCARHCKTACAKLWRGRTSTAPPWPNSAPSRLTRFST